MFNWFNKKKEENKKDTSIKQETIDAIEESLWEIKEEYDLPTEEIVDVVYSKRNNIDFMHKAIRNLNKEKK